MERFSTNRKIENLLKETELLVALPLLKRNEDLFGPYDTYPSTLIKSLINILVKNEIKALIDNARKENPSVSGGLVIPNNSIFSIIDYSLMDDDKFDSKIPLVPEKIVDALYKKVSSVIRQYKDRILPNLKLYKANITDLIGKMTNVDYSTVFKYVGTDWDYLYDLILEGKGFITPATPLNRELDTFLNPSIKLLSDINILKSRLNIKSPASLSVVFEDWLKTQDVDTYLEQIAADIDAATTYGDLATRFTKLYSIASLPKLIIAYTVISNTLDEIGDELGSNERSLLVGILNHLGNYITKYIKNLQKLINEDIPDERKVVIYGYSKNNDRDITIYYIVPNFEKIKDQGIKRSTLAGAVLSEINRANVISTDYTPLYINGEKLLANKINYNDLYESYLDFLSATDRNRDRSALLNIYTLALSKLPSYIFSDYSTIGSEVKAAEYVLDLIDRLSTDELLDVDKTATYIFSNMLDLTNFGTFVEYMENSKQVLGDDINSDKAAFYATLRLLTDYLVTQVRVI
jgi:hypothetical protein